MSVEDQASADERIPLLLQCPAALRFQRRAAPRPGHPAAVDVRRAWPSTHRRAAWDRVGDRRRGERPGRAAVRRGLDPVGGRAVQGRRRAGVRQAARRAANVPLHTIDDLPASHLRMTLRDGRWHLVDMRDRKGADPSEWPEDLRVQEFPR